MDKIKEVKPELNLDQQKKIKHKQEINFNLDEDAYVQAEVQNY